MLEGLAANQFPFSFRPVCSWEPPADPIAEETQLAHYSVFLIRFNPHFLIAAGGCLRLKGESRNRRRRFKAASSTSTEERAIQMKI